MIWLNIFIDNLFPPCYTCDVRSQKLFVKYFFLSLKQAQEAYDQSVLKRNTKPVLTETKQDNKKMTPRFDGNIE